MEVVRGAEDVCWREPDYTLKREGVDQLYRQGPIGKVENARAHECITRPCVVK